MTANSKRLWFAGKLLLTAALIFLTFAAVIPSCIIPATASHVRSFAWSGLAGAGVLSCLWIYCVWFWR